MRGNTIIYEPSLPFMKELLLPATSKKEEIYKVGYDCYFHHQQQMKHKNQYLQDAIKK
jgi:hypothetical protein